MEGGYLYENVNLTSVLQKSKRQPSVNTLFSWPFGIKRKVCIALRGIICIFRPFGTPKEEENVGSSGGKDYP
jgi:hypothetical protein